MLFAKLFQSRIVFGKKDLEQDKFDKFISPTNGYFRETCKSQNKYHLSNP